MAARVRVIAGTARSGKTALLLDDYRSLLSQGEIGSALWLAPTRRAAGAVRDAVLAADLKACFSPNCLTFAGFAQTVLDAAPLVMRPVTSLMRRLLLRRALNALNEEHLLDHFGSIAHTPGLLDLLVGLVSELKRVEIWPDHFLSACQSRGASNKDRELHRLYERYQSYLTQSQLYDAEGKFWTARELLRDGHRKPWLALRHVFVDGFTDFTRTQHEILDILAERVESLTITLPLEDDDSRQELFAKPRRSLAELRRRHADLQLEKLRRRTANPAGGLTHLESHVFHDPRRSQPSEDNQAIEIIAAAGQAGEVDALARTIKQLLADGDPARGRGPVRPGDILVLFRTLSDTAPLVREVFGRWGIPVSVAAAQTLNRSPMLTALVTLLRVHLEDWPFRPLLALMANNFFRPTWPECQRDHPHEAAEYVLRQLQVSAGKTQILRTVERWSAQAQTQTEGEPEHRKPRDRRAQRAKAALPLLRHLDQALARLPKRATARDWGRALEELAIETGILATGAAQGPVDSNVDPARADWEQLLAAIDSLDRLSAWLEEMPAQLSQAELFEALADILRYEQLPAPSDETGCVRVLDAPSARNLTAEYVFLAGLSEKAFPPADRDDRLYGQSETDRLIAAGLPLTAGNERSQEEMLLFYEALTRATRRLYLSYSALDSLGQPLSPSPYLTEVERACGKIPCRRETDLSPIPRSDGLYCPRDLRVKAVAQALAGEPSLLAGLDRSEPRAEVAQNIAAGLRIVNERQRGQSFGPFEGIFAGGHAIERLSERFGPDRCWSTSQLEQYAHCPFQFLLKRVLRLEELPDLSLDVDYLTRGRALHAALAALHTQLNDLTGGPASPCGQDAADFLRAAETVLEQFFEMIRSGQPVDEGLREIDRRRVLDWIAGYREQHRKYDDGSEECDSPLRPTYFEISFGPVAGDDAERAIEPVDPHSVSTPRAFELTCGSEVVRLAGRIDRIDVGMVAGQPVFNIVDYKSGLAGPRHAAKAIEEFRALQLPLYALAVQELVLADRGALPWSAAYWYVQGQGYKEVLSFSTSIDGRVEASERWASLRPKLLERVAALVRSVRQGQFPMHCADEQCTSQCGFNTVCRVNQVRALEKSWQPTTLEPVQ